MPATSDAVVVGSGPNGLAAAVRLALSGWKVEVVEAASAPGGGARSAELTLPGFLHDPYAAVFPITAASPFLQRLALQDHGLHWLQPTTPLAHPLDDGTAVTLYRDLERTAVGLQGDGEVYKRLMQPLLDDAAKLIPDLLAPPREVRHPIALARFGQHAIRSATGFVDSYFHGDEAAALFAGIAAHSFLPLSAPLTAGFGLFLAMLGHYVGWPIAAGGAQRIADALVSSLRAHDGTVTLDCFIRQWDDLPLAPIVLFDTDPRQLAAIAGTRLPSRYRAHLNRHRYGPGVFKIDYALDGPVPWTAADCLDAGTVHVGGTLEEIAQAEWEVSRGRHPDRPFLLVSQPSLFDPSRAPAGKQTLWTYCHVPAGSNVDMTDAIEQQLERFAPGFRDRILARHVMAPADLQANNPNLVGGAINGGLQNLRTFGGWALAWPSPYATPNPALIRCSSATPPGGGVHGMAGFHAAEYALRRHHAGD